jgi:hypothetical protein
MENKRTRTVAKEIFEQKVSSTNSIKSLNGMSGKGCVCRAAKAEGIKAKQMDSLMNNGKLVVQNSPSEEHRAYGRVMAKYSKETNNL